MLQMIARKMYHNGWLVFSLLFSSVLVVALMSSIPIYTDGIFQRLLTRDLEDFQISRNVYPGSCNARYTFYTSVPEKIARKPQAYEILHSQINQRFVDTIDLPLAAQTQQLSLDGLRFRPDDHRMADAEHKFARVEALQGLEEHVTVIQGRMFSGKGEGGSHEVMVTEQAMHDLDLLLDKVYVVNDKLFGRDDVFRVKVVGVFTYKDQRDPFWFNNLSLFRQSMLVDYADFVESFVKTPFPNFTYSQWFFAFDYYAITLRNIARILAVNEQVVELAKTRDVQWIFPAVPVLEEYRQRAQTLRTMLWFLQVPILLMLAFFIYMLSQLIIEYEGNEIALLKSRGSSGRQVFLLYLLESVILGVIALAAGPPLGLLVCRFLGSANGFMEFVQRSTLSVSLGRKAYLYALFGVLFFVVTMMLPTVLASRATIIQHKAKKVRRRGGHLWKRTFLDLILIGISAYGYYSYRTQQQVLAITGVEGQSLPLDPLLFVISVFFILGSGLFVLRLYPYLIRILFWLGRKVWTPVLYASFVQVGRSFGHEQFLMIFLVLSLGMGIYNSVTARTINRNREERIRYMTGADIVVEPVWEKAEVAAMAPDPSSLELDFGSDSSQLVHYIEPPFLPYSQLPGVELATKVYRNPEASLTASDGRRDSIYVMGIVPEEFGKVAWFRTDLLPSHWYNYLNLLSRNPKAFLVSRVLKDRLQLRVGDPVYLSWANQMYLDGYVFAFIDFWPTHNPFDVISLGRRQALVVANLAYVHAKMILEPYEIWIKRASHVASRQIYDSINERKLRIERLADTLQLIIREKNDPMLQGTNGSLTLGFVITMVISAIGFFFYWVLSLKSRTLQFGILRAMGLKQGQVTGMLICEQVLISGTAVIIGILIGNVASRLFVPLLQVTSSSASQIPPFRVIADQGDFIRVYGVVGSMLAAGALLFRYLIAKISIHQAIKLGEE